MTLYFEIIRAIVIIFFEISMLFYFIGSNERTCSKPEIAIGYMVLVAELSIMVAINVPVGVKALMLGTLSVLVYRKIYNIPIKKLVIEITLYILFLLLSEMAVGLIFTFFSRNYFVSIHDPSYVTRINAIICSKIICFLMLFIVKKMRENSNKKYSLYDFTIIGIPLLSSVTILLTLGLVMTKSQSAMQENIEVFMIIFIAVMCSSICSIMVFDYYIKAKTEEYRDKVRLIQMESQFKYYKDRQEDEINVERIYHDLKNHLLLIQSESGNERKEFVGKILNKIKSYESYIETGNKFLNIIICEKIKCAREKNIIIEAMIDFSGMDYVEPMDISTLFGNAIDNAIEACADLKEDKKIITVKARKINDSMVIKFENPYENKLLFFGDKLLTTKENKKMHGFGTENIKRVVEKYGGYIKILSTEGRFTMIVKMVNNRNLSNYAI